MKSYRNIDIIVVIFAISTSVYALLVELGLPKEVIPTVINGLTASISVIVGFTGAFITVMLSNPSLMELEYRDRNRVVSTLITLGLPLAMLWYGQHIQT